VIGLVIASCILLAIDPSPNTIPLPPVEVDSFRASYVPEPVRVVVVERQIALRSCFGAGTPVLTRSGPQPIERVEVGDLVLSQDTVSGALSYRPVVAALHNPPAATLRVILGGGESITAPARLSGRLLVVTRVCNADATDCTARYPRKTAFTSEPRTSGTAKSR
jgi:hypothetical protein